MLADGAYVRGPGFSGYYVSFGGLIPQNRDKGRLEGFGVVFRDEHVFRLWQSRFAALTSSEAYWDMIRPLGEGWGYTRSECFRQYGFWEVGDDECRTVPGHSMRLHAPKHRRGKKHKMRPTPLYDAGEEVSIEATS